METYKANARYRLLMILGTLISILTLSIGLIEFIIGNYLTSLTIILLILTIFYILLFIVIKEVSIESNKITFKTEMRNILIDPSEIKSIKTFQSVNILIWYSGDMERAPILCIIKLKGHPLRFVLFGNTIEQHKRLYSRIQAFRNVS